MNKKNLLIKIVKFINKANIKYKEAEIGDMMLLIVILLVTIFGNTTTAIFVLIIFLVRAIFEFDILEKLEIINEEENNKAANEKTV